MMRVASVFLAAGLGACQAPEPAAGPASLQIVPPSYYSPNIGPRPGPPRRQHAPIVAPPPAAAVEPARAPSLPEPGQLAEQLREASRRLDAMNRQLQALRRSITRPANPRGTSQKGPAPIDLQ